MKNWITNIKANKDTITEYIYSWAGKQFVNSAIVIGVTWAAVTIASGFLTPEEMKVDD